MIKTMIDLKSLRQNEDLTAQILQAGIDRYAEILNNALGLNLQPKFKGWTCYPSRYVYGWVSPDNHKIVNINMDHFEESDEKAAAIIKEVIPHEVAHCFEIETIGFKQGDHTDTWRDYMQILNVRANEFLVIGD